MYKLVTVLALFIAALGLFYLTIDKKSSLNPSKLLSSKNEEEHSLFSYWKKFKPASGKFEVMMPSTPQYAKDFVGVPNTDKKRLYEIYASEKLDGTIFMVSVITYPNDMDTTNTKDILKNMVDELIQGRVDNKLNELKEGQHQSHLGYSFDLDNAQFKIKGKTFLAGKTLYILSYIVRKDDFILEEYDYFANSFNLLQNKV